MARSGCRCHEDITRRKEIESALRDSEEKYRTLTERFHDGIYIYQGDRFVYVNDRVSEITGYSKEELYSMNLWGLIDPEDLGRVQGDCTKPPYGQTCASNL